MIDNVIECMLQGEMGDKYSYPRKEHQRLIIHDRFAPTHQRLSGELDIGSLKQTSLFDEQSIAPVRGLWHHRPLVEIKLKTVLSNISDCVGRIELLDGQYLGSCVLISTNCVLMARHTIQGIALSQLKIRFRYHRAEAILDSPLISINHVIEHNVKLDYVIVSLPVSASFLSLKLRYARLATRANLSSALILLHHPLGKPLKVSIHKLDHSHKLVLEPLYIRTLHDSDFGSSGGAYFNAQGELVAMHLGTRVDDWLSQCHFNVWRYAVPLSRVVKNSSFIKNLSDPKLLMWYPPNNTRLTVERYPVDFIEIEMRENRRRREEKKAFNKEVKKAVIRTDRRLAYHSRDEYEIMSVRKLMTLFPKVGIVALANAKHQDSNKTTYMNPNTGWHIVYDQHGDYNTVRDELGHYVALDGSISRAGKDAKYHFRNNE